MTLPPSQFIQPQNNSPITQADGLALTQLANRIEYEFEFQYTDNPLWVRADISIAVAYKTILTGLLLNKAVSKVKLFTITEGEESVSFIYDVGAAKSGNQPWSLSHR